MSITVRYQNGYAVTYNSANYVRWNDDGSAQLYTQKDGDTVARVLPGSGAIVELLRPCSTSNPSLTDSAVDELIRGIRHVDAYKLVALKRALDRFSTRRRAWRDK